MRRGSPLALLPFCITIALLMLSSLSSVHALSVSPATRVFDAPGTYGFTVIARNEGESGIVSVRAQGDLAGNVRFSSTSSEFTGDVAFEGTIDIPQNITPGDHTQEIILSLQSTGGGTVSASVEVVSLLVVRQTYAGPYLVADIYAAPDNGINDTTNVYITLENRGDAAVTPEVTLLRERSNGERSNDDVSSQEVSSQEIPARQSARLAAVLHGRGEERITLVVEGAQPLRKEFTAAIGHPLITRLEARAIPDAGDITPIVVTAAVSWNRPYPAAIIVDGKEHRVLIDGESTATYYAETNASLVPVALVVGAERREIAVPLGTSGFEATLAPSRVRWEWFALIILLALLGLFLYRIRRKVQR